MTTNQQFAAKTWQTRECVSPKTIKPQQSAATSNFAEEPAVIRAVVLRQESAMRRKRFQKRKFFKRVMSDCRIQMTISTYRIFPLHAVSRLVHAVRKAQRSAVAKRPPREQDQVPETFACISMPLLWCEESFNKFCLWTFCFVMSSTTCFQGKSLEFPAKKAQRGLRIFGGDFKVYEIEDKRDYTSEPHSDWINVALHLRTTIQVECGSCMRSGCTSKIPFKCFQRSLFSQHHY